MTIWLIAGIIVGTLALLSMLASVMFMLTFIRGGHNIRGYGYEQKLYLRNQDKYLKYREFDKKRIEEDNNKKKESMPTFK